MWLIAKEDPHGIVHEVQPVGSYYCNESQIATYHLKFKRRSYQREHSPQALQGYREGSQPTVPSLEDHT